MSAEPIPQENLQPARILPLWKAWLEETTAADRIKYGEFFPSAEVEKSLCCREDSMDFAFAVSNIRKALRRRGMNLSARGQKGEGYMILQPQQNAAEMQRLERAAKRSMREGVILGTNTPLELLSADDRRRHESQVEKMAMRLALINRRGPVRKELKG